MVQVQGQRQSSAAANSDWGMSMNDPEVTMLDTLPSNGLIAHSTALEAAGLPLSLSLSPDADAGGGSSIEYPVSIIGGTPGGHVSSPKPRAEPGRVGGPTL